MGLLRRAVHTVAGSVAWRWPGHPRRMLSAFARAEHGSALDMLAAIEPTDRPDLRRKFFLHAMDEWRHADLFRRRAAALGPPSADEAGREEAGLLVDHGIVGGRTLYERLGPTDFLAFVYVAEADAVEQFKVYLDHQLPDPETRATFERLLKDELFHVSYSHGELKALERAGRGREATGAVLRVRWQRLRDLWLRASRRFGAGMSTVWLAALYVLVIAPARLVARVEPAGWKTPSRPGGDPLASARAEG